MESFVLYFVFSVAQVFDTYRLVYLFHLESFGSEGTVGENDSIRAKVAIVRFVSEVASYSHVVTGTVRCRHFDTLIHPVPDETTDKCRIVFIRFPVFFKVTY